MKIFPLFLRAGCFGLLFLAGFSQSQAQVTPSIVTLPATHMTNTIATLNGAVDPGGIDTTVWFEWGTTTNYSSKTIAIPVGSGTTTLTVSNGLSGLTPGIIYHGRLVGSNLVGQTFGKDVRFGSPIIELYGPGVLTNECNGTFNDPGAIAYSGLLAISAGTQHNLVLRSDGTVFVWGNNAIGQTNAPPGMSGISAISAGYFHSLVMKDNGTFTAWGDNEEYGQSNIPSGLTNVIAISAGHLHNLVLKSDGTVVAWGRNGDGESTVPSGLSNVVAVSAGSYYSLALKGDGKVVGWGRNHANQLNIPAGLSNVVAISAGANHCLALKKDGTVAAWGYHNDGQIDVPADLSNVVAVAAGGYHSLALKRDGKIVAWGNNQVGQTRIPFGLSNVVSIAAGIYHNLALRDDGRIIGWGYNDHGESTVPAGTYDLPITVTSSADPDAPGTTVYTYTSTNVWGGVGKIKRTLVLQDTLPPILTLAGSDPQTNFVGSPFLDPGATASDACDGSLPVTTNGFVNINVPGSYTVTYTSTDNAGNTANLTRTVVVRELAPFTLQNSQLTNGIFFSAFTNLPGATFTVLTSTNVALPTALWTHLGPATEVPMNSGQYQFTDPQATNHPIRFYLLRSP